MAEPVNAVRVHGSSGFTAGLVLTVLFALLAAAAPLLSRFAPNDQLDVVAGRYLAPGSRRFVVPLRDGSTQLATTVHAMPGGFQLRRQKKTEWLDAGKVEGPMPRRTRLFILGTDRYGRDIWSRLLFGARVSLLIGLLAAALAASLGSLVGGAAAAFGGLTDQVLMRTTDGVMAFPRLFLLVAMAAIFPHRAWVIVLVIGGTGWMGLARIVRGELLSLQQRDFIAASRAAGVPTHTIVLRHLFPHVTTPILVEATTKVGETILAEAALSFLGLGIQPPNPSWGSMIAEAADALTHAWWAAAVPGLALTLCALGFNLLGDGLRDRLERPGA
jgi:peptide/nickel transport system permease protein